MMNKHLIFWSITVGLGGFLFGMDTAVISGAEQDIQKLWGLSSLQHGLAIAMALYGTVVGAAFGGLPADRYGRKTTLLWIGILFFFSAIGSALADGLYAFMLWRFIGGLSIGASSVVAPVYISEIAPPKYRGRMVISFQMNIVIGILVAYLSNYWLEGGANDWRYMLGIVAVPALLFSVIMWFTPETPRWLLLKKNDKDAALKILQKTEAYPEKALAAIAETHKETDKNERLFTKKYSFAIILAFLIAFFNQVSGINAIIYYAPRIFEMTGLGKETAMLSTTGIGVFNLAFTIAGWYLIDRLGRKQLMLIGSIGYIITLSCIAYSFFSAQYSFVPWLVFLFIAAHAIGQGAVIWVFISEIFPTAVRAGGATLGSLTHWIFAAIIANVFPILAEKLGGGLIFSFFAFMMVLQLFFVLFLMPETKGISLEDLQKKIVKN
jgi:MFS transporter, SP family, arabinose:H+ symporter